MIRNYGCVELQTNNKQNAVKWEVEFDKFSLANNWKKIPKLVTITLMNESSLDNVIRNKAIKKITANCLFVHLYHGPVLTISLTEECRVP